MTKDKKIDIIMFGMSDYTDWQKGITNRNYQVFQTLIKDERVGKIMVVDFLPINFGWQRKVKYFYRNILRGAYACDLNKTICNSGETRFGDLTSRCYQVSNKVFIYSSVDGIKKVSKELAKIKTRLEMDNVVIWSYNPLIGNLKEIKEAVGAEQIIFDAVDDWSKHSAHKKRKAILEKSYQQINKEADIIFTVSQELKNGLFGKRENVYWIPNGVEVEKFSTWDEKDIPLELQKIKKPIIGYIGVIQDRFDLELVKYLAQKNQDKSFVFIGWLWKGLDEQINREFANLENVHFLGRKTYDEAVAYLNTFDLGIIPHKVNEFTSSMNPLKMYEYLACGKPVVSTAIAGVADFGEFIKIAKNKEEFNEFINTELLNDNLDLKQKRIKLASENSWENRVEKMMEVL